MTIEEKVRVYSGLDQTLESNNLLDNSTRYMANCGFRDGAKWMLEKATIWIAKQGSKANDGVVMLCVDDFVKAMEEE